MAQGALVSPAVAVSPAELELKSLRGEAYPLHDWLTSYPFLLVALDPYTAESSWILETGARLLAHFSPADVRVGWLVAADDDGCRQFLGPWAERFLTFPDPDRTAISTFGFERLPGLLHVRADGHHEVANGWAHEEWRSITDQMAKFMKWSRPAVPAPGDPTPYQGTAASGTE